MICMRVNPVSNVYKPINNINKKTPIEMRIVVVRQLHQSYNTTIGKYIDVKG